MQQGLSKFLGVKNKQEENISKFERMSKGKSKQEVRELERKLLKPEPIPIYVEEHSKFHIKKENAFKVVFSSKEDVELVKKFLYVSYYVEPSIGDMSLLIDLLKAMDSGEIIYDKKEGKFHEKCQGRKINRRDC
jgi:hypothetical protein